MYLIKINLGQDFLQLINLFSLEGKKSRKKLLTSPLCLKVKDDFPQVYMKVTLII